MKVKVMVCPACETLTLQVKTRIPRWRVNAVTSSLDRDAWYCLRCHKGIIIADKERAVDLREYSA